MPIHEPAFIFPSLPPFFCLFANATWGTDTALKAVRRESMIIAWVSLATFVILYLIWSVVTGSGFLPRTIIRVFDGKDIHFERVEESFIDAVTAPPLLEDRESYKWRRE
jgi:hypothetical protein